jgi:hypothetical protein
MPSADKIHYIKHADVDRNLWNNRITKAANSLIYGRSEYLDAFCTWDAVVANDYQVLMPLPWKAKYGIKYIYTPPFMQQLGLFSSGAIASSLAEIMIRMAKGNFRFGEYYFNYGNEIPNGQPRSNFILNLERNYSDIQKNYKSDLVKNLKKSIKAKLYYKSTADYRNAVNVYRLTYGKRTPHVGEEDYLKLIEACKILFQKNMLLVREVKNDDDELLSIALCLKDARRLYLIASTTTENGRNTEANHYLIDQLIREFAGQKFILDFEGSDISGIAHFYKNFGAENQPYFFYRWNNLPWPLNLLKS